MLRFAFLCAALFSSMLLAQEVKTAEQACSGILCNVMQGFPELNAWLIAVFTLIGLILRASAEFLGFVGKKISNKAASNIGVKLAGFALYAAKVVGWFGGGTPKVVLDAAVEKKLGDVDDSGK